MTAVLLWLSWLGGCGIGCGAGIWWSHRIWQARNEELENRLRECNQLLRNGRLTAVSPEARRRLMLITSNVRNSVLRGK